MCVCVCVCTCPCEYFLKTGRDSPVRQAASQPCPAELAGEKTPTTKLAGRLGKWMLLAVKKKPGQLSSRLPKVCPGLPAGGKI